MSYPGNPCQPSTSPSWADVDPPAPPPKLDTVPAILAHCAELAAEVLYTPGPLDSLHQLDGLERQLPWALYRSAWEQLEELAGLPDSERLDFERIEAMR